MASVVVSGDAVGHWTADRLQSVFWEGQHRAIGLERDGLIVAGTIYENWNTKSIMCHMVVEGRLTRDFISAIFSYAYRVCGVSKVICPVASSNTRSRRLLEHMGFSQEAELKDCHPEGDVILYTLSKSACRFLGSYGHRQEGPLAAPGS